MNRKSAKRVTCIPPPDSRPNTNRKKLGRAMRTWDYIDKDGNFIGCYCQYNNGARIDSPEYELSYALWTYARLGENLPFEWSIGRFSLPAPLYNLNRITADDSSSIVVVVPDVISCDVIDALLPDCIPVTWPVINSTGNADYKYTDLVDWSPLAGRKVIFFNGRGDDDAEFMGWLAWKVKNKYNAKPREIHVLNLPDSLVNLASAGWDIHKFRREWNNLTNVEWPNNIPPNLDSKNKDHSHPGMDTDHVDSESPARAPVYDDTCLPPEYSQVALAMDWTATSGLDWRYTAAWNAWFQWDKIRWRMDDKRRVNHEAKNRVVQVCKMADKNELPENQQRSICSREFINSMLCLASSDPYHAMGAGEWDHDDYLLGTPGGTVDLRTGKIRPSDRKDNITRRTRVAPAEGETPVFDMAITRATGGNDELLNHYRKWFGYILTGDTKEEAFLFIHGPGGSGKSKLINAIKEILGDYAATADMGAFIDHKNPQHTENLARLQNVRMVCATETEEGSRWNESLIKKLTGRETITARFMAKNSFEYEPKFKIVFGGNHKPGLKSVGFEMQRRIHLMEFPASIPKDQQILDLPQKMALEYPAILHKMIQWCLLWQREGLNKPMTVEVSTQEYLDAEDTLGKWITARCDIEDHAKIPVTQAYKGYKLFTEAAGEYVVSQKRFTSQLEVKGYFVVDDDSGTPCVCGLRGKIVFSDNEPTYYGGYSRRYN